MWVYVCVGVWAHAGLLVRACNCKYEPPIFSFGWKEKDLNLLAAGSLAGHLIECGAQVSSDSQ